MNAPATRWLLTLGYDGGSYHGWQAQRSTTLPTVQNRLETALSRFNNAPTHATAAGRTDRGVHALAMSVHTDLTQKLATQEPAPAKAHAHRRRVRNAVNYFLKKQHENIAVIDARRVRNDFHARHSATARTYAYRISEGEIPQILDRNRTWLSRSLLDADAMHRAAQRFLGEHDFSAFRDPLCTAPSPVRRVLDIEVQRHPPRRTHQSLFPIDEKEEIIFTITANGFLQKQVRKMAALLVAIGNGSARSEDITSALGSRDRRYGLRSLPAHGLYFVKAHYPDAWLVDPLTDPLTDSLTDSLTDPITDVAATTPDPTHPSACQ